MYSSENSHKATSNADLNSRVGQPSICRSTGHRSGLSDFYWLVSSLSDSHFLTVLSGDLLLTTFFCSFQLTLFFWSPLSTNYLCLLWDLPSLVHFQSRGRSCTQALCVGFAPKRTKEFSDWHAHTPTQRMLNIVSHWGMWFGVFWCNWNISILVQFVLFVDALRLSGVFIFFLQKGTCKGESEATVYLQYLNCVSFNFV